MTPAQEQKLNKVLAFMESLERHDRIPLKVSHAFEYRLKRKFALAEDVVNVPPELAGAPLSQVTAPTGGVTIDGEARTAINALITRMEDLGLIEPN